MIDCHAMVKSGRMKREERGKKKRHSDGPGVEPGVTSTADSCLEARNRTTKISHRACKPIRTFQRDTQPLHHQSFGIYRGDYGIYTVPRLGSLPVAPAIIGTGVLIRAGANGRLSLGETKATNGTLGTSDGESREASRYHGILLQRSIDGILRQDRRARWSCRVYLDGRRELLM